jgi:glycosyltransferase involved in cell wall biosynthesis
MLTKNRTVTGTEQMQVSVILPVMDETTSLRKTVDVLMAENLPNIAEILIIVCKHTTPAALEVCEQLLATSDGVIKIHMQKRPFLGGAMQDAFELASGTHVLMMASDLETDPYIVKELIAKAAEGHDIVTATRWTTSGGFEGYDRTKYLLNWVFQRTFRTLYGVRLSDLTYGFRIFKTKWVKTIAWEELRHAFLLETILKPLRLGAQAVEVPARWRMRVEGTSHNLFLQNLVYFRIALKTRFRNKEDLLVRASR